jgi:transcriptional regulator with XRE-family HTH domain
MIHYELDLQSGPRLRAWLEAQQPPRPAEIARRAGVSRQFIANVMAGRAKPSARVVKACEELGLPVDLLFREVSTETAPARTETR